MAGFGNEIRFKIGGDSTALERTFDRVAQKGTRAMEKVDRATKKMVGGGAAVERARATLEKARERRLYEEANTVGKIKILTREIADYAYARQRAEKGSLDYLKAQAAVEERMGKLRSLQRQQQSDNLSGNAPAQSGGGGSGLGAGIARAVGSAVVFGLTRLNDWFQSRIELAQTQATTRGEGLTSLRGRFAAIGGLQGQLRQGTATEKDLELDKRFAEQRRDFLSSGAQGAVSKLAPGELLKAEQSIEQISAAIQRQHDANALIERDLARQNWELSAQLSEVEAINRARQRGSANEVRLATIRKQTADSSVTRETLFGTPESLAQARIDLAGSTGGETAAMQSMRQHRLDTRQALTEQAAQGRTFAGGGRRPRSETERIAARAAMFRDRARSLTLSGSSGGAGVAAAMASARGDETTVAGRLSRATAKAGAPDVADLSRLPPLLITSNKHLAAIDNALKAVDVSVGNIRRK